MFTNPLTFSGTTSASGSTTVSITGTVTSSLFTEIFDNTLPTRLGLLPSSSELTDQIEQGRQDLVNSVSTAVTGFIDQLMNGGSRYTDGDAPTSTHTRPTGSEIPGNPPTPPQGGPVAIDVTVGPEELPGGAPPPVTNHDQIDWSEGDSQLEEEEEQSKLRKRRVVPGAASTPEDMVSQAKAEREEAVQNIANAPSNAMVAAEDGSEQVQAMLVSNEDVMEALGPVAQSEGFDLRSVPGTGFAEDTLEVGQDGTVSITVGPDMGEDRAPVNDFEWVFVRPDGTISAERAFYLAMFVDRVRRHHPEASDASIVEALRKAPAIAEEWAREELSSSNLSAEEHAKQLAIKVEERRLFQGSMSAALNAVFPLPFELTPQGPAGDQLDAHVIAQVAAAAGGGLRKNLTYLEGGNVLVGRHSDGQGYAIVGVDSLAINKALLSSGGKEASDETVKMAMAKDLGIDPKNLFLVEQPDYHLDLHMMLLPGGGVIVNDARTAVEVSIQKALRVHEAFKPDELEPGASAEELQTYQQELAAWETKKQQIPVIMRAEAEKRGKVEDEVARQLTEAGFNVHRLGGVFLNREGKPVASFFNGEQGIGRGGHRFFVTPTLSAEQEALVRQGLDGIPGAFDPQHLHFVGDEDLGSNLLSDGEGSLGCDVKLSGAPIGEIPVNAED